jgi:dTDP-4-amino-4,6-dideoxygalactose transaminase
MIELKMINEKHTRNQNFVPFALPSIGEEEIETVVATLRSGWLTTGPRTKEFEKAFAEAVGARHALAVNSATGGLHLALEAVGIGADDLVLVPTWTFTATAEVTRYLGAHPVFVDVEADTLNIDVKHLEQRVIELKAKYDKKLKAVVPVHFAGQACEMDAILDVAERYGLKVIEDAAHAFPTTVTSRAVGEPNRISRKIGTVGHATVFSFYATKTIATGEGGMVTTNDDRIAERISLMRLHGINRDVWNRYISTKPSWYYEVVAPGYKYNLTDIASAIGLVQLRRAQSFQLRREFIAQQYHTAFRGHPALEIPSHRHPEDIHAWHLYVLRLKRDRLTIDRNQFIQEMALRGVGCSVHFIPLHMQPYWRDRYGLDPAAFPVATKEFERVISLPIYPRMTDTDVKHVIDAVLEIANKFSN